MQGIIVKDWEALALRNQHKTSLRKPLSIPAGAMPRQGGWHVYETKDGESHTRGTPVVPGSYFIETADGDLRMRSLAAKPGEILYVKETWRVGAAHRFEADARIEFKAGGPNVIMRFPSRLVYDDFIARWDVGTGRWNSHVTMPPEAARFFLRVSNIQVERLQDISDEACAAEGIRPWSKDGRLTKYFPADRDGDFPNCSWNSCPRTPRDAMQRVWDEANKNSKQQWAANPWVQAISFELVENRNVSEG